MREETPVCPEKLFLAGDKGVLLSGAEEEFGFLAICSFGSLENKQTKKKDLKYSQMCVSVYVIL